MIKRAEKSNCKRLNKTLLASVLVISLLNDVSTCLAETGPIMNANDSRLEVENSTESQKMDLSITVTNSSLEMLEKVWQRVLGLDPSAKPSLFEFQQLVSANKNKAEGAAQVEREKLVVGWLGDNIEQLKLLNKWLSDKKEEIKQRNGNPILAKERLSALGDSNIRGLERVWQDESGLYPDLSNSLSVNYMWQEAGVEEIAPEQHFARLNEWLNKKVEELQQIRLGLKE